MLVEIGGKVFLTPYTIRYESQIYSVNVDGRAKRALTNASHGFQGCSPRMVA
jgi:hypothetical protein